MKTLLGKKIFKKFAVLGLASASFLSNVSAEGTSTAEFLRIGQGARAEGMGGAFTAIADDAYATYWNPAGLAQITRQQLGLNHLQFIEKINSQFASYAVPVNRFNGTIGVSAIYADFGSIDRRDANNVALSGDKKVSSYAGAVSWGQAIGENIAIGAGLKALTQDLAGETASGIAGDVGFLMTMFQDKLTLGFAGTNFGPKIKVGTVKEDLPRTLRAGLALHLIANKLTVAMDGEKERDSDTVIHVGGEYLYMGKFIIRGGYQDTADAGGGISAGAGFIWRPRREGTTSDFFGNQDKSSLKNDGMDIRLDYGFVDYGDFSGTHRLGVHFTF